MQQKGFDDNIKGIIIRVNNIYKIRDFKKVDREHPEAKLKAIKILDKLRGIKAFGLIFEQIRGLMIIMTFLFTRLVLYIITLRIIKMLKNSLNYAVSKMMLQVMRYLELCIQEKMTTKKAYKYF